MNMKKKADISRLKQLIQKAELRREELKKSKKFDFTAQTENTHANKRGKKNDLGDS